ITNRDPTTTTLAHDLLASLIRDGFSKEDWVGFHSSNASLNSARKNSWVPFGPARSKVKGSLPGETVNVNSKNGQHKRSPEMNSAAPLMISELLGKLNSYPFSAS